MAIHHLTPPVRGGERRRLPSSQQGPVSVALAAMHAADPDRERIRRLRRRIAERIEADIALLDALDGDCDLEDDDPGEDGDWHGQHIDVRGFDGTNYNRWRA